MPATRRHRRPRPVPPPPAPVLRDVDAALRAVHEATASGGALRRDQVVVLLTDAGRRLLLGLTVEGAGEEEVEHVLELVAEAARGSDAAAVVVAVVHADGVPAPRPAAWRVRSVAEALLPPGVELVDVLVVGGAEAISMGVLAGEDRW